MKQFWPFGLKLAEKVEATRAKTGGPRKHNDRMKADLPEKRVLDGRVAVPVTKAGTKVVVEIGWCASRVEGELGGRRESRKSKG